MGIQQGVLQAKQEVFLQRMREFVSLTPAIVEQIEEMSKVNRLDALLEKVLRAQSLEEMGMV